MRKWIKNREMMKSHFDSDAFAGEESDQTLGMKQPPLEIKPLPHSIIIDLPEPSAAKLTEQNIYKCFLKRKSRRKYSEESISLKELSYMLWATQGLKRIVPAYSMTGKATLRTVPSAGARHTFETYLAVNDVTGMESGIYRYSALNHNIVFLFKIADMNRKLTEAAVGQSYVGRAPVIFLWACKPYLGEWRYKGESHKAMLLDAGHVCQNLYLAAESLNLGTVAIAAYSQNKVDELLRLDGNDEFIVYLAPVGRVENAYQHQHY